MMNNLAKKYDRLTTLCSVALGVIVLVLLCTCQYLEKEETVVDAFIVVCIGCMTAVFLFWLRDQFRDAANSYRNFGRF
jgi:hypothetical protein